MRILVLNAGSSSLKFKLFNLNSNLCLCVGMVEKIAEEKSFVSLSIDGEKKVDKTLHIRDHQDALETVFDMLFETGVIVSIDELTAVGHRVVHGGEFYSSASLVTDELIQNLKSLIPLAPLHNPANIAGIEAIKSKSKSLKQVAVFDTAFHQTMPSKAFTYALPISMYKEDKIRRYGFHGSSHSYVLKEAAKFLNKEVNETNVITLHLGNGASVCAIKEGKSMDTSMGFTPLEGLVMGTRSGDLDPAIIFYLHKQKAYALDEIDRLLNKHSGLLGLCGENDMRLILEKAKEDETYQLAIDIFVYRIKKYIGAYLAVLGEVDALVFTGGIGEHSATIREMICRDLEIFGIEVDTNKNGEKEVLVFSTQASKIALLRISTDEELEIALQTRELLK